MLRYGHSGSLHVFGLGGLLESAFRSIFQVPVFYFGRLDRWNAYDAPRRPSRSASKGKRFRSIRIRNNRRKASRRK